MGMPIEFEEIARLSDLEYSRYESVGVRPISELVVGAVAELEAQMTSDQPPPLVSAMDALDTQHFKELMGWVLFGRDYSPSDGDPQTNLNSYIEDATIYPREEQSAYLESKPMGKFLRQAQDNLSGITRSFSITKDGDEDYKEER